MSASKPPLRNLPGRWGKIARIIDRGHENAAMSQEAHAHYGDKFTRTDAYVYFIRGVLTAIFQKPE
jgi:hypothetical protein